MPDKINPVRETDQEALTLAKNLAENAKYGALGVREIDTGVPLVSRVAACWSEQTGLFFCASDLSVHSKCLAVSPVCSLMLGEPGKGDGLAYPRITFVCKTERLPNATADRPKMRAAFVARHPKAELYVDFGDFGFYPLEIERALLNGGFGKAFRLAKDEIDTLHG